MNDEVGATPGWSNISEQSFDRGVGFENSDDKVIRYPKLRQ